MTHTHQHTPIERGSTADETALRALVQTFGLLNRVMQPYFLQFGLSIAQWAVLRVLYRAEQEGSGAVRLRDLGARLLIRPPSVTGVVDRLQRAGLVQRSAAIDDLRAKHVALTSAGRDRVERVLQGHRQQIHRVLGGLSPGERVQLQRLLQQLDAHLEELAAQSEAQCPARHDTADSVCRDGRNGNGHSECAQDAQEVTQ